MTMQFSAAESFARQLDREDPLRDFRGKFSLPLGKDDTPVIDFAVWCSYKYLNGGPGAVAGAFVHERHATNTKLPRLAGWFGNDPNTRFRLHLEPEFIPVASADGWQISNPSIFSMAPLRASLAI